MSKKVLLASTIGAIASRLAEVCEKNGAATTLFNLGGSILKELQNEFKDPETVNEIINLIKQYDLTEIIKSKAENELRMAKECLLNLKIDIHPLLQLTQFSVI